MPASYREMFSLSAFSVMALTFCFGTISQSSHANPGQNNPPVIIDAANGNSHLDVQAVLDAYPENTTFQMTGAFEFAGPVHIEKSGTRLLGDWVDLNADGKPDQDDEWNTVITGITGAFGVSEGFYLIPRDEVNSTGYEVDGIEISGIHFSGFNLPIAVLPFPHPGQAACRTEPLPYRLTGLLIQNNWVEGGSLYLYRSIDRATIDNNLISLFEGLELYTHGIEMRGATYSECGLPFGIDVRLQRNLSITNNTFTGGRDVSVGFQQDLEISGNVMTGALPYPSMKLWLSQASGAQVINNVIEADSVSSGVLFWSKSFWPGPEDLYSEKVEFVGNEFIDTEVGIWILGGTDKTSIRDNHFEITGMYGATGIAALVLADVAPQLASPEIVVLPSTNVEIARNHIGGGALAGIVVNGETTGLDIHKNTFDNPSAVSGDVLLAPEDVVFGSGLLWGFLVDLTLCPAQGNKVTADNGTEAVVTDGYSAQCEGSMPNKLNGLGISVLAP